MAVEVKVAAVLQKVVGGVKVVEGRGSTVGDLIKDLDDRYPGFASQVLTDEGQLHRFVNIYLNDEDIRYLGQLETPVHDGDVVSILPALAGGARPAWTTERPAPRLIAPAPPVGAAR